MPRKAIFWFVMWVIFGLPWTSFSSTPHWDRAQWNPFPLWDHPRDDLLNFLFYAPLGAIGVDAGWRVNAVLRAAAVLSATTEIAQVFSVDRSPETTDIVMNVAGAAVGSLFWLVARSRARSR